MTNTVSVPKSYLDTLMRRADVHESDGSIKISLAHYRLLVDESNEFRCLKAALITGGASQGTLDVLIRSQAPPTIPLDDQSLTNTITSCDLLHFDEENVSSGSGSEDGKRGASGSWSKSVSETQQTRPPTCLLTPISTISSHTDDKQSDAACHPSSGREGKRSLALRGVPKSAEISNIIKVLRGGSILNIYLQRYANTAYVSFVEPESAQAFLLTTRQSPISINGKRIQISWAARQAYVPEHMWHRVLSGEVTRNLVIRFPGPGLTPETIQEDLDHIHRLEVVNIDFDGGHAWIQLNSIIAAVTAKACMQSRLKYKNSKIEFFADECSRAFTVAHISSKMQQTTQAWCKAIVMPTFNRFSALSTASSETSDTEDID